MATVRDVASAAKVSVCSASKVLNDCWREARISADCAQRVRDAARALRYIPNHHAQALPRGYSSAVGLVRVQGNREAGGEFNDALIAGVDSYLLSVRHDLIFIGETAGTAAIANGVDCLQRRKVDALVVLAFIQPPGGDPQLAASDGSIVMAFRHGPTPHPTVDIDCAPGIDDGVRLLVEQGHRSIAWFAPEAGGAADDASRMRRSAFMGAAARHGARVVEVPLPAGSMGDGKRAARDAAREHFARRLAAGVAFSAVMCFNDACAIGVYQAAYDRGVRIPRDLSVIGFDDLHAEMAVPRLTTVSHMLQEVGQRAGELAVGMARDAALRSRLRGHRELIPSRLVVRESTAPPLTPARKA